MLLPRQLLYQSLDVVTKVVITDAMTKTVKDILELIGEREEIAHECGVEPIAVYRWGQNNSIPSKHLSGVLRVASRNQADVTADSLLSAHDRRDDHRAGPADTKGAAA